MKIGNVELEGSVILAPMAGVCNSAFRKICKEMGCALVCAEMVSDKGMIYNSKKTEDMLYFEEVERPISQQIFGSDKETFTEAAKRVYEIMHPDIIDINMGCPVPKVAVKSQAGSALLKNPELIREIVTSVVNAVPVPVTVKIRSGWDFNSINAVEVAKICEEAGAKAITVHPRTRSQLYSGKADLNIIKEVKANVNINGKNHVVNVYVDKTPPTVNVDKEHRNALKQIYKFQLFVTDNESGINLESMKYKQRILKNGVDKLWLNKFDGTKELSASNGVYYSYRFTKETGIYKYFTVSVSDNVGNVNEFEFAIEE